MRRKLLFAALTVVLTTFVVAGAALVLDRGFRDAPSTQRFDAIVVLGCRVNPGGRPSNALARRAEHAAALYHEGRAPLVVVTGGVGDYGPSEASVAARVLEEAGVPREAILLEDTSTSTWENATEARARFGGGRVLIVTDSFHTFRAERIFERLYDHAEAVGSHSPWMWPRTIGAVREVLAVAIYAGVGRIDLLPPTTSARAEPPGQERRVLSAARRFRDDALPSRWYFRDHDAPASHSHHLARGPRRAPWRPLSRRPRRARSRRRMRRAHRAPHGLARLLALRTPRRRPSRSRRPRDPSARRLSVQPDAEHALQPRRALGRVRRHPRLDPRLSDIRPLSRLRPLRSRRLRSAGTTAPRLRHRRGATRARRAQPKTPRRHHGRARQGAR
ncbi:MAG: YdcF family protein [Polyangiaceae bacterium]|nr:YdcF family protein [Polyangiaceae bacterium]